MIQTAIALILFLFPLAYSPGPGNLFFAANGARFGFSSTVWANLGYHIATWIVTAVIGFGFAVALDEFPTVFLILKIAGSLYVLRIAWRLFNSAALEAAETARHVTFMDGVILLVLNPKAYVIITLMFTQFLGQTSDNYASRILMITTVFTLNNLVAFSIWALIGDTIARYFRTPKSAGILNRTFGLILACVGVWMLLA